MSQGYYTPEGRLRKLVPSGAHAPRGRVLSSEDVDYGEDEYSTPLVNPLTEGEIRSSEPEPESTSTGICGEIDQSSRGNFCDSLGDNYEFTRNSPKLCYAEGGCSAEECCRPKQLKLEEYSYNIGETIYFREDNGWDIEWVPGEVEGIERDHSGVVYKITPLDTAKLRNSIDKLGEELKIRNTYSEGDKVIVQYDESEKTGTVTRVLNNDIYNIKIDDNQEYDDVDGQRLSPQNGLDYKQMGWNKLTRTNPKTGKKVTCYENIYTKERQFEDPRNDMGIIHAPRQVCEDPDINQMIEVNTIYEDDHDCNNYYVINSIGGKISSAYNKEAACRIAATHTRANLNKKPTKKNRKPTKKKRKPKKNKSKNIKKRKKSKKQDNAGKKY